MGKNRKSFFYLGVGILGCLLGWYLSAQSLALSNLAKCGDSCDRQKVIHTLERLSFGIVPQQIANIESRGVDSYIQEQLNPQSIDGSRLLNPQLSQFKTINRNSFDLFQGYKKFSRQLEGKAAINLSIEAKQKLQRQRNNYRGRIVRETKQARLVRAIYDPRQLQEVMVNFWLDHFNVVFSKKIIPFWLADYESDIRKNALGNFRDLLYLTARHPAMLVYLDNELNVSPQNPRSQGNSRGLNENYARELMELHTLGVDGGYTQEDVTTLARILTGWGLDYTGDAGDANNFRFFPEYHDNSNKVFLGNAIAGAGIVEGEQALDILANHPATARHISYKLAQYFVADKPPATLVDKLERSFIDSQGDIKSILTTLFYSDEFNDPQYYQVKFKTPFQYFVSIARSANLQNIELNKLESILSQLSMPTYGCATPDGYKNTEEAWLNPESMLRRLSFATQISNGTITKQKKINSSSLQKTLGASLTTKTQKAIADTPPFLKGALILGSPEMMYR